MTTPPIPTGFRLVEKDDDESQFVGTLRGLNVVSYSRNAKTTFRGALQCRELPIDEDQLRRWWPAADRPSARDIAQSVLRNTAA